MKTSYQLGHRTTAAVATVVIGLFAGLLVKAGFGHTAPPHLPPKVAAETPKSPPKVELLPSQLDAIKIAPVGTYPFPTEKEALGSIDYDEDVSVQVFSPYSGKIITALANLGDDVQQGQPLYTIASPDLIQAESILIGAAANHALTTKELARAKELAGPKGVSEREIEQATSDQHTAEGALKAARDAVRLFGKSDIEIEQIEASRKIDLALVVVSPLSGRVTARNAQPGLLVQPGSSSAPYAVADLSRKWMVANVTESDSPLFQTGQSVRAKVMAFPGRIFEGRISRLGPAVDPNTHRVMVRCEIPDPKDELRPGMLASFVIRVQEPVQSAALPMKGVVRNGDGTMAAWVTSDRRQFLQRLVTIGQERDDRYQILAGLEAGEWAVTDGAIFLSNMLDAPPSD